MKSWDGIYTLLFIFCGYFLPMCQSFYQSGRSLFIIRKAFLNSLDNKASPVTIDGRELSINPLENVDDLNKVALMMAYERSNVDPKWTWMWMSSSSSLSSNVYSNRQLTSAVQYLSKLEYDRLLNIYNNIKNMNKNDPYFHHLYVATITQECSDVNINQSNVRISSLSAVAVTTKEAPEVVGYMDIDNSLDCALINGNPIPYLSDFIVSPLWRKRGIGHAMLKYAEEMCIISAASGTLHNQSSPPVENLLSSSLSITAVSISPSPSAVKSSSANNNAASKRRYTGKITPNSINTSTAGINQITSVLKNSMTPVTSTSITSSNGNNNNNNNRNSVNDNYGLHLSVEIMNTNALTLYLKSGYIPIYREKLQQVTVTEVTSSSDDVSDSVSDVGSNTVSSSQIVYYKVKRAPLSIVEFQEYLSQQQQQQQHEDSSSIDKSSSSSATITVADEERLTSNHTNNSNNHKSVINNYINQECKNKPSSFSTTCSLVDNIEVLYQYVENKGYDRLLMKKILLLPHA